MKWNLIAGHYTRSRTQWMKRARGRSRGKPLFPVTVAGFGQLLRGDRYTGDFNYDDVANLARKSKGNDEFGYRSEFIRLVRLAETASGMASR